MSTPRYRRSSLLAALFLALFSILGGMLPTVRAQQAAPSPSSPYGIAGVMRWPDWGSYSRPVDAMLQTGGSWVREDFAWGLIEPQRGRFSWTATDRIVGALHDKNLNVLGIISYSANWATPAREDDSQLNALSFYPPDPALYYTFVHTLVSRYKHAVRHWEVWNEPDNELFWKPRPDARKYSELLKVAYRAIKDADPGAQVLTGGVSGNAVPFLEEMLAAGAGNSFDILALHPYAVPVDQTGPTAAIESRPEVHRIADVELNKYSAFLARHNLKRRIWVTEIGWPARYWGLNDQQQASYLSQAYAQMLATGIPERIFWYSFKDASPAPQDSWGLVAHGSGGTDLDARRPSFAAYATSARMLAGARPQGRISVTTHTVVESFERGGPWARSMNEQGSFTIEPGTVHEGAAAGRLSYNFPTTSQAVDFSPATALPIAGRPSRLGVWVRGDASGNYLSAWLRDAGGELFKVRFGAVTAPAEGFKYFEASLNSFYFPYEKAGGNPANGTVDYPVSFVGLRLENTPDEPAGSGTIYIDELRAYDGPDVSAVRFARPDGSVVDVLWSANSGDVRLPSRSEKAQVIGRDGAEQTVTQGGDALTLKVGDSPIYVAHSPADSAGKQIAGAVPPGSQAAVVVSSSSLCDAAPRAADPRTPGNMHFAETGHNLSGPFRRYWERHGGLMLFGFPITEEYSAPSSDGKLYTQQLFERARFELHPEAAPRHDVQLGLLGVWASGGRSFVRGAPPVGKPQIQPFPETGQAIDVFKGWWTSAGGLPVFGFPLSGELQEKSAADGKTYLVQYFERNRLEYHPELKGTPNEVLLGLLGTEFLARQKCDR